MYSLDKALPGDLTRSQHAHVTKKGLSGSTWFQWPQAWPCYLAQQLELPKQAIQIDFFGLSKRIRGQFATQDTTNFVRHTIVSPYRIPSQRLHQPRLLKEARRRILFNLTAWYRYLTVVTFSSQINKSGRYILVTLLNNKNSFTVILRGIQVSQQKRLRFTVTNSVRFSLTRLLT